MLVVASSDASADYLGGGAIVYGEPAESDREDVECMRDYYSLWVSASQAAAIRAECRKRLDRIYEERMLRVVRARAFPPIPPH